MKQFGFCDLAVIPVRREPSDKAEMSTQLLFGDLVTIQAQQGSWLSIQNYFDDYEGWIDAKQIQLIDEEEYSRLIHLPLFVNRNLYGDTVEMDGGVIRLPAGCSFYNADAEGMIIGGVKYAIRGELFPFTFQGLEQLIRKAMEYQGCPYLWGGKTVLGLDCSGLTQVVYKQSGIKLFRDAAQQATQGELVSFRSESRQGDLAFFDNDEGRICHVGIILDHDHILHCSGQVRIDILDHQGIFNPVMARYTHKLRLIRRVAGC
jgi:gamma-D-glutamyl-L-lysine dipeptidyl-peptidase